MTTPDNAALLADRLKKACIGCDSCEPKEGWGNGTALECEAAAALRDKAEVPQNPKLLRRIDQLEDKLNAIGLMLDQLPDPDQHPHDLQADYRAWLHDFDKDLP